MPLEGKGKWVKDKIEVIPGKKDCYIYKRPGSNVWQYFLAIPGEGAERKSTGEEDENIAKDIALDRKLESMSRQKQGLKVRRVKKMFDFIDDFLKQESKRIADYVKPGNITQETFRLKSHHLNLLKKFYHNKSIKLENLDYPKLQQYPIWRTQVDKEWNPKPPKTNHTILTELTTIKAYFDFLREKGYINNAPEFKKLRRESLRVNRRDYLNPREYMQTINTVRKWSNSKSLIIVRTSWRRSQLSANSCSTWPNLKCPKTHIVQSVDCYRTCKTYNSHNTSSFRHNYGNIITME